jgi:protein-L-isoaspartate(D-aspartate) O-methyltransferase
MIDYAQARRNMVEGQLRTNSVTDPRLLDAMSIVERERFVPASLRDLAYLDMDLALTEAAPRRHLLEPLIFARLAQSLDLTTDSVVLDVGCATGYSAVVLSHLAGTVVGVESDTALAAEATANVAGRPGVTIVSEPFDKGAPRQGPYDAILLEGSVDVIPQALIDQLKDGGRLAAIVGTGRAARAVVALRAGSDVSYRHVFEAAAPILLVKAQAPAFEFPL